MTFTGSREMGLLARLDRFVHWTRLDSLTPYAERRPRNLRWWPLVGLGATAAGYAMHVIAVREMWALGPALGSVALLIAGLLVMFLAPLFGPFVGQLQGKPLDERELALKARAGDVSGGLLTVLVIFGCAYFSFASVFDMWMPANGVEWGLLALALSGVHSALNVLAASWLQAPPETEEEEG